MRSRLGLITLSVYLAIAFLACTSKPNNNPSDNTNPGTSVPATSNPATSNPGTQNPPPPPATPAPVVVPAGTSVTVSLGSALGSKLSQPSQRFNGTVAKDVSVGDTVAIPKGSAIAGTVTDAKPLGKLAGGAVLQVRLDSINLNGANVHVHAALRTFSVKGKGKRTGVMAGGGAALGGIIGAIAGRGKGAAIGAAAGGGAGAGGAALTGNKDIVLPAESAVTFTLSQALEVQQ
jgi:hypothetical protein